MGRIPPLRLLWYPGSFLAIVGASAILAAVTVAGPTFLSSMSGATLHRLIQRDAEFRLPTIAIGADSSVAADVIAYRTRLLERELGPFLGDPIVTARGDSVVASAGKGRKQPVRIAVRTGFLEHVERLQGTGPGGIWIADVTAQKLNVEPGEQFEVRTAFTRAPVTVAGVYRDLLISPRDPFWSPLAQFIYSTPQSDTRPPPLMLMDLESYLALEDGLRDDQDALIWEFRLPTRAMSVEEAEGLEARLDRFESVIANTSNDVGAAFRRSSRSQPLTGWLSVTTEITDPVSAPVGTLALAGQAVALAMLIGSGVFMMRRRRVEVAVLHARGVGPARFGLRTMVEVALPIVLGTFAGSAFAVWIVERLGDGGPVGDGAIRDAIVAAAWMTAAAIVLLGAVAARSIAAGRPEGSTVARATSRMPWDILLVGVAIGTLLWLRAGQEPTGDSPPQLDPLFLLFPLLLLTGAAGLAARALRMALPRLRRWAGRGPGTYLATRRLAAAPRSATWLLVASSVAVGILVYAGTLTASLGDSATQDAALAAGSEAAVTYTGVLSGDPTASFPVTSVARIGRVTFAAGSTADLDVLLVDADTFADAAFWRGEFAGQSLDMMMSALALPSSPRVPAVVAGAIRPPEDPILSLPGFDVPIEVVGRARTFPGIVGARPTVVVDAEVMRTATEAAGQELDRFIERTELWARAEERQARAVVTSGGGTVSSSTGVVRLRDTPRYLAVRSMLRFLLALGVLAAAVVGIAVVLYLQSRQRRSETSYALARRMGLSSAAHLRSIVLEMAVLLLGALAVGGALALIATSLINADVQARALDVDVALFRVPIALVGAIGAALIVFAVAAAAFAQWRADRADVAEVMRVVE
ncbi:MAG TPA: FtsX-like permease family protein [Actinomycetota bacterium]|nr:FtsX-like permease family protein [Actinomycetota bacterium]